MSDLEKTFEPKESAITEVAEGQELPTVVIDDGAEDPKERIQLETAQSKSRRERAEEYRREREERHRREDQERAAMRAELAALREQLSSMHRPAPTPPQATSQSQDLLSLEQQRQLIIQRLATPGIDQAEQGRLMEQYNRVDAARIAAIAKQSQGSGLTEVDVGRILLQSEFPEVWANPAATTAAEREYNDAVNRGEKAGIPLARKIAKAVLERMHGAPATASNEEAKLRGTSSRPGASGGPKKVTLSKDQMAMARALYGDRAKSDAEAAELWVKNVAIPGKLL